MKAKQLKLKLSLQENAKYCVILILKTVIPTKSILLDFQNFERLVFDVLLSKTEKQVVFLMILSMKKKDILNYLEDNKDDRGIKHWEGDH